MYLSFFYYFGVFSGVHFLSGKFTATLDKEFDLKVRCFIREAITSRNGRQRALVTDADRGDRRKIQLMEKRAELSLHVVCRTEIK